MTWSSLVPAYSVGLGWCRVTSQVCLGAFLAGGVFLGHVLGDGLGDGAVEEGDPDAVQPRGEHPVDVCGGLHGEGVGLLGDPAGPPERDVQGLGAAPGVREPVDQVEGVGHQRHRRTRGDAEGEAEGFGCERGHRGVPSPPRDSSASRWPSPPQTAVPVSGVAGCRSTTGRRAGAGRRSASRRVRSLSLRAASSASGPRSSTPDRLVAGAAHGSSQAPTTDTRRGSEPLVHKGIEDNFRRTATTTVDPEQPCAERPRRVPAGPKRRVTTSLENQRPRPRRRRRVRVVGGGLDTVAAQPARPTKRAATALVSVRCVGGGLDTVAAQPARPTRVLRNLLDQRGLRNLLDQRGLRNLLDHRVRPGVRSRGSVAEDAREERALGGVLVLVAGAAVLEGHAVQRFLDVVAAAGPGGLAAAAAADWSAHVPTLGRQVREHANGPLAETRGIVGARLSYPPPSVRG